MHFCRIAILHIQRAKTAPALAEKISKKPVDISYYKCYYQPMDRGQRMETETAVAKVRGKLALGGKNPARVYLAGLYGGKGRSSILKVSSKDSRCSSGARGTSTRSRGTDSGQSTSRRSAPGCKSRGRRPRPSTSISRRSVASRRRPGHSNR
ncbi:MAG: hypothetical protein FJX72_13525 [Armatimonadetes bacterium]|nr:hypothetical protein [Armatimonadota bacterium]